LELRDTQREKITVLSSAKAAESARVKYWEIIADNLSKAGWSWGIVSAIDSKGQTTWIADAHRGDGKRFIVQADELLTAFLELESLKGQRMAAPASYVASGLFRR
jgi:hypothetical protein